MKKQYAVYNDNCLVDGIVDDIYDNDLMDWFDNYEDAEKRAYELANETGLTSYLSEVIGNDFDDEPEEIEPVLTITREWKVYGADGHRQKESFCQSCTFDFSEGNVVRKIEVCNSDITGTNDYSLIRITRNTFEECEQELLGQLYDGIFENCRVGKVEEI